jgi:hypothetical protein
MSATELVKCIGIIKDTLSGLGLGSVKVGTADSWNLWVNGANSIVIKACDIVLANAFSVSSCPFIKLTNSTGKVRISLQTQHTPSQMTSCKPSIKFNPSTPTLNSGSVKLVYPPKQKLTIRLAYRRWKF